MRTGTFARYITIAPTALAIVSVAVVAALYVFAAVPFGYVEQAQWLLPLGMTISIVLLTQESRVVAWAEQTEG